MPDFGPCDNLGKVAKSWICFTLGKWRTLTFLAL